MQEDTRGQQKAHATNLTIHRSGEGVGNIDQKFCQARRMSASYLSAVEARSRDLIPPSSAQSVSTLLGDKQHFRKTLVRHMVSAITEHFPGRPFEELMLLEFGSGAGFFAKSYSEIFGGASLPNLVQTDASPRDVGVAQLDVANITSSSSVLAFYIQSRWEQPSWHFCASLGCGCAVLHSPLLLHRAGTPQSGPA